MEKTLQEIRNEITADYIENEAIQEKYGLDPDKKFDEQFSVVSFERIFFYILAFIYWVRQSIFSTHKQEVEEIINDKEPHHARWYANKVLDFQYGFNLLPESDQFDNAGKTDDEIEASKVVKYASVIPQNRQLVIKAARIDSGDLAPLLPEQLDSLIEYMQIAKDAGVEMKFLSDDPEQLKLIIDIYYNPLVLNSQGQRIDDLSIPVPDAIRNYLNTIQFNGTTVIAFLEDALQAVDGVVIPYVKYAAYKYGNLDWIQFDVMRQPDSGYMRIADENLIINYIPRNAAV